MSIRSVRIAYVIPPLLGVLLGFLGLVQVSEDGLIGVASVVTASSQSGAQSNARVSRSLERVAADQDATIARVVADAREPSRKRVSLVTGAPSTSGRAWLDGDYRDFAPRMTTRIQPMSQLVHYDTAGRYAIIGDDAARRAVVDALTAAGFSVTSETIPITARFGISDGLDGAWALIAPMLLGCMVLCLVGTVGNPRRAAVQRLGGRSATSVVRRELSEVRVTIAVAAASVPLVAVAAWFYNGAAFIGTLGVAATVFCVALTVPVIIVHASGTILSCRMSIAAAIRGTRPSNALVIAAHIARVPALALFIGASFTAVGSFAVASSGDAERELRAAGEAVQLWVTPEPRQDRQSSAYWNRIGEFTGRALDDDDALLAAAVEVRTDSGRATSPVLFVDRAYLCAHPLHDAEGSEINADPGRVTVWLPQESQIDRDRLVSNLWDWELRDAPRGERAETGGGSLAESEVYTYPGDDSVSAWLDDAAVVVVPDPTEVFSADQLGSWLSTGDIVFTSDAAAQRSIRASDLGGEFSAVVAVGQNAADRVQHATTQATIDFAALLGAGAVVALIGALAATAHTRRNGRALFTRFASGASFVRSNAGPLTVEVALIAIAGILVVNTWLDRRPDGTGQISSLDPIARSAGTAGVLAGGLVLAIVVINVTVLAWNTRRAVRTRGRES